MRAHSAAPILDVSASTSPFTSVLLGARRTAVAAPVAMTAAARQRTARRGSAAVAGPWSVPVSAGSDHIHQHGATCQAQQQADQRAGGQPPHLRRSPPPSPGAASGQVGQQTGTHAPRQHLGRAAGRDATRPMAIATATGERVTAKRGRRYAQRRRTSSAVAAFSMPASGSARAPGHAGGHVGANASQRQFVRADVAGDAR